MVAYQKWLEKKRSCAVACVAGSSFAVFFLLWFVKYEIQPRKSWTEDEKKTMGEGAREEGSEKNVSHAPLPHRSFFILGSAFAWLNILFYEPQIKRKNSHTKKTASYGG